jgi:hypothetical protein
MGKSKQKLFAAPLLLFEVSCYIDEISPIIIAGEAPGRPVSDMPLTAGVFATLL